MTTEELKNRYSEIERRVQALVAKKPQTTSVAKYKEYVLQNIDRQIDDLADDTAEYINEQIPKIYTNNTAKVAEAAQKEYNKENDGTLLLLLLSAADERAILNSQANVNAYLSQALQYTRDWAKENVSNAEKQARQKNPTQAKQTQIIQETISAELENGIPSASYERRGERVQITLGAYGKLVLDSSEEEIKNISTINFGANNGYDLVKISEHYGSCPLCLPYQGRVYSISGTSPYYPALYETPWSEAFQNFHPNCRHYITPYIESTQAPEELERERKYSNRSFEVGGEGWTKAQTQKAQKSVEAYREGQKRKREAYNNRRQFERYKERLGDKAPKTLSGFLRVKSNASKWAELQGEYRSYLKNVSYDELFKKGVKLSNEDVRTWYVSHVKEIHTNIDTAKTIEEQARQAFEMRNSIRTQARNLMADVEERKNLDKNYHNVTFEEKLQEKMSGKGLTREEAVEDILKTAIKSNKTVNKKLGLSDE